MVEVLITAALMVIVFGGLFASFQYSLKLVNQSRTNMTVLSLVTDRMEYIRSLSYDEVGTIAGIPSGAIPQNRTVTLNEIEFNERVLIEYIDDPADGLGALDDNDVLADYKKVKIEYTWTVGGVPNSFFLISNIVPRAIETTAGGGSLRVNVFDADVAPLPGISVRLFNDTTTSTIDVTRSTNADGVALFTGAPAASNYQIFVSAPGYSSDQTYQATTSLPNPSTLPISILEGDVSTMSFQVDRLSNLAIRLLTGQSIASTVEEFTDLLGVYDVSSTTVSGGELVLDNAAGVYESDGIVTLPPLTPSAIENWGIAEFVFTKPAGTDAKVRFYTSTSSADLIPDSDLAGNSVGFSERHIDLRGLAAGTYPTIVPTIQLSTLDTAVTPSVDKFTLAYVDSVTALGGSSVGIKNNKTIGTLADASPVYKYSLSTTTDGGGRIGLTGLEWGVYDIGVNSGYVIKEACPAHPYNLLPNVTDKVTYLLAPSSAHNLRVMVQDGLGKAVIGAAVRLSRSGFNSDLETGWCGQVFFGGLATAADYELQVSADGFSSQTITSLGVSDAQVQTVTLLP